MPEHIGMDCLVSVCIHASACIYTSRIKKSPFDAYIYGQELMGSDAISVSILTDRASMHTSRLL